MFFFFNIVRGFWHLMDSFLWMPEFMSAFPEHRIFSHLPGRNPCYENEAQILQSEFEAPDHFCNFISHYFFSCTLITE